MWLSGTGRPEGLSTLLTSIGFLFSVSSSKYAKTTGVPECFTAFLHVDMVSLQCVSCMSLRTSITSEGFSTVFTLIELLP